MVGHLRARIVLVVAMLAGLVPFIANELIWTRSDLAQQLEAIDKSMASSLARTLGCVDKRDSQISRGLIQGFFFGGGSLGLSERCERRCVGDH